MYIIHVKKQPLLRNRLQGIFLDGIGRMCDGNTVELLDM